MKINKMAKISSVSFILMLIISTIAIAYMIGSETRTVSAATGSTVTIDGVNYRFKDDSWQQGSTVSAFGLWDTGLVYNWKPVSEADGVIPNQLIGVDESGGVKIFGDYREIEVEVEGLDSYKPSASQNSQSTEATSNTASTPTTTTTFPNGETATYDKAKDVYIDSYGNTWIKDEQGNYLEEIPADTTIDLPNGQIGTYNEAKNVYIDSSGNSWILDETGNMEQEIPATELNQQELANDNSISTTSTPAPAQTPQDISDWTNSKGNFEIRDKNGFQIGVYNTKAQADAESKNNPGSKVNSLTGSSETADSSTTNSNRGTVKVFGTEWGFGAGQLLQGLQWAGIAAGLTMTLGSLFIKDKAEVNAMTAGIAGGIIVGKAAYALLGNGGVGGITQKPGMISNQFGAKTSWLSSPWTSAAIGAASAWLIYNAMWSQEKVSTEVVSFKCLPWEAPHGGADCELCNDATLPCSEYRCKSLGQSCAIVNKGTKEERCVNINPRDSSPPVIKPNNADLSEGFEYFDIVEMPPGAGFKIKSTASTTGCLPAYTPIQFGITTNEPSQCKIDVVAQGNYSKMAVYLNGDNLYKYNHTEFLNLPSSADIKNSSITLKNGKELVFYIRCQDAAGNANEADYAMTLCVDPSPDNTAPVIQGTSIENKGCVPADTENATVEFYINEPSECKWDYYDKNYEQMNNNMSCSTNVIEINAIQSYTCITQLKGVARDGNNFYVRCKDQPQGIVNDSKRNTNKESYVFNLRRSNQLKLKLLKPNETIYGAVRPTPVELYTETLFGCEDNKAVCYYSTTGSANSFVQFFDTDKADGVHTQRLDLNDGTHTYFVRCVDAGGNIVNASTTFRVSIDTNAPVVARAYEEEGYLKLVTPLNSECVYNSENCDYLFNEGIQMPYANSTTHVTEWFPDKKYFIKCRDEYRSEPVDCSLVIRPTENFLEV